MGARAAEDSFLGSWIASFLALLCLLELCLTALADCVSLEILRFSYIFLWISEYLPLSASSSMLRHCDFFCPVLLPFLSDRNLWI